MEDGILCLRVFVFHFTSESRVTLQHLVSRRPTPRESQAYISWVAGLHVVSRRPTRHDVFYGYSQSYHYSLVPKEGAMPRADSLLPFQGVGCSIEDNYKK